MYAHCNQTDGMWSECAWFDSLATIVWCFLPFFYYGTPAHFNESWRKWHRGMTLMPVWSPRGKIEHRVKLRVATRRGSQGEGRKKPSLLLPPRVSSCRQLLQIYPCPRSAVHPCFSCIWYPLLVWYVALFFSLTLQFLRRHVFTATCLGNIKQEQTHSPATCFCSDMFWQQHFVAEVFSFSLNCFSSKETHLLYGGTVLSSYES